MYQGLQVLIASWSISLAAFGGYEPLNHPKHRDSVGLHRTWSYFEESKRTVLVRTPIQSNSDVDRICDFVASIVQSNGDSFGVEKVFHEKVQVPARAEFWMTNRLYPDEAGPNFRYIKSSLRINSSCITSSFGDDGDFIPSPSKFCNPLVGASNYCGNTCQADANNPKRCAQDGAPWSKDYINYVPSDRSDGFLGCSGVFIADKNKGTLELFYRSEEQEPLVCQFRLGLKLDDGSSDIRLEEHVFDHHLRPGRSVTYKAVYDVPKGTLPYSWRIWGFCKDSQELDSGEVRQCFKSPAGCRKICSASDQLMFPRQSKTTH